MSHIQVISRTQHLVVNPVDSSVSVINSGPVGPTGATGPPDASSILTVDGQIMTRVAGALGPITRADLAADTAFTSRYTSPVVGTGAPSSPEDGDLWWDTDDTSILAQTISAETLALDVAFTDRYSPLPTHRVAAVKSSVQSVPHTAVTLITWPDTEEYDTDSIHSTSVNTSRLTIPAGLGGVWRVGYSLYFAAHANNGRVQSYMTVNGGGIRYGWTGASSIAADDGVNSAEADIVVSAGAYIEVSVYHANGGSTARNLGTVGIGSRFWATFVGSS